MHSMLYRQETEEGGILIVVLVALVLLGIIGSIGLSVSTAGFFSTVSEQHAQRAFHLAEAGIRYAFQNTLSAGTDQTYDMRDDGSFSLVVAADGSTVTSTGNYKEAAFVMTRDYVQNVVVTNTNDSGAGSLRYAIENVPDGGQVTFDLPSYPETIKLTSTEPDNDNTHIVIDKELIVDGPGAEQVIIDSADNNARIFLIDDGEASNLDIAIQRISMAGSEVVGSGFVGVALGGALLNRENLILEEVEIRDNVARSSGFFAISRGSGIANYGAMQIYDSCIAENSAVANGFFGTSEGGGIYSEGQLAVYNTTVSSNAADDGAGIFLENTGAVTKVHNCTITRNDAGDDGGGIYYTGNTIELISSIVADNEASGSGDDIFRDAAGAPQAALSLIGSNETTGLATGSPDPDGNYIGSDASPQAPRLQTNLKNNGGETRTHKLRNNSVGKDTGDNPNNFDYDQRGSGYPRVKDGVTDMGAYEAK